MQIIRNQEWLTEVLQQPALDMQVRKQHRVTINRTEQALHTTEIRAEVALQEVTDLHLHQQNQATVPARLHEAVAIEAVVVAVVTEVVEVAAAEVAVRRTRVVRAEEAAAVVPDHLRAGDNSETSLNYKY